MPWRVQFVHPRAFEPIDRAALFHFKARDFEAAARGGYTAATMPAPRPAPLLLLLLPLLANGTAAGAAPKYYDVAYRAHLRPEADVIDMEIALSGERLPSRVVLRVDPRRHRKFTSTDPLQIEPSHVTWQPRGRVSRLRYQFVVDHERSPQHYDSRMTKDWAIFRAEKLVPHTSVTARRSLHSRATLEFELPQGWTVATPYGSVGDSRYTIDDPEHRFDQPRGWMLAGRIGSRNEKIGDVRVVVAAPTGDNVRRQDTLAFLKFTLPRLQEVFPQMPPRLLIVSAGDPMWRGGLSGPSSMFLHSDRPLISENRTSTLLHELVHIALGVRGDEESDWIVEGLAEYYSLETLRRSGGISEQRHKQALRRLAEWARRSTTLFDSNSDGATTARAVLALRAVDAEIRSATGGKASLDDVARKLASERGTVSLVRLQKVARDVAGRPVRSLEREQLAKPVSKPTAARDG
jgi:predicted metalloprotease with PDZ domain